MNILLFSPQPWPFDEGVLDPARHVLRRTKGELAGLLASLQTDPPDVLLLCGFAPDAALLRALEALSLTWPRLIVMLQAPEVPAPRLLDLMRVGVRDVLPELSGAPIREALARAQQRLQSERPSKSRVLAVISIKDGDGGTCVAANLGHAVARLTHDDVLLLDLSLPFGDLDMYLTDRVGLKDVVDVSAEAERIDGSLLQSMVHPLGDNLHLIASPASFEKVLHVQAEQVQRMIEVAERHYPQLVLAMGSALDRVCLAALARVDDICLVASPSLPSIRRLTQVLKLLQSLDHPDERVSVLVNRFDPNGPISQQEMEKVIGRPVRLELMLEPAAEQDALLKGKPIVSLQPDSRFSLHIQTLASELSGVPLHKPSLWQRLRKK
jgi:pilus assembly protein CpaE